MKTFRILALGAFAIVALAPLTAQAQYAPPPDENEPQPTEPEVVPPEEPIEPTYYTPEPTHEGRRKLGLSVSLGGGVSGFTDSAFTDITGTGGNWDVRVVGGTRMLIGLELAYLGTAQSIDAIGLSSNASLISNGLEGNLRVNLTRTALQPYVFAGASWRRFDISSDRNTSDLKDTDDVFEIPAGGGVDYRVGNFLVDARFTFRSAFDDELIAGEEMNSWNASANLGWEF